VINCPKSFRFLCSLHAQLALTKKCCFISCVLGFRRVFWINSGFDLTPLHVEFVLEKNDTETGLSPRTSVSLYQYNSTSASYSHFIYLPSTPRNDNNLQQRWISTSVYSSVFPLSVNRLALAMKRDCVLHTVGIEFFQHVCHGDEFQPI